MRSQELFPLTRTTTTTALGPVGHVLMGAASGILAVVGVQYLLLRLSELGIDRGMRTTPES